MPAAPIVVRCPCGVETRAGAGDVVTCSGCGARYDTGGEAAMLDALADRSVKQFRYLNRAGIGAIGLPAIAGLVLLGVWGLAAGAVVGGVLWYGVVMRLMKRRILAKAASLHTPTITPSRK
jgi:hypothetical protein